MINPDLTACSIGTVGELLVQYRLMGWGEEVCLMTQDHQYDLVVLHPIPIRVQVKASLAMNGHSYRFNTGKGRSSKDIYKKNDYDILCCVALDLERIHFLPFIDQKSKRLKSSVFTEENEYNSWSALVDSISQSR